MIPATHYTRPLFVYVREHIRHNAHVAVQLLCAFAAPTMQAGIHFGVAIRAIHYPVSVGYTIRRFSRRNNADISTLASPSPVRGWPGWPKRRWFRGVSDNIFLRHEGTRHTPILFLPVLSFSLSFALFFSRRRDATGEITHFENACQPVRLSIAATSGIHDNV